MSLKIEWVDGAPKTLDAGMVVEVASPTSGELVRLLIGDLAKSGYYLASSGFRFDTQSVIRYGYLIKPHELEWLSHMAGREAKARPEE